jgi:hypothetical protein
MNMDEEARGLRTALVWASAPTSGTPWRVKCCSSVSTYHLAMQCNIDAKGKAVRLRVGVIVALIGVILLVVYLLGVEDAKWVIGAAIAAIGCGAFAIYEGWAGWCVMRALGFKTRV